MIYNGFPVTNFPSSSKQFSRFNRIPFSLLYLILILVLLYVVPLQFDEIFDTNFRALMFNIMNLKMPKDIQIINIEKIDRKSI